MLTAWPTPRHRDTGGWAIRAATHPLSATGDTVRLNGFPYPPALDPSTTVTDLLSTVGQSLSIEVAWLSIDRKPLDTDFSYGVGELAIIWETDAGRSHDSWDRREVRVQGRIKGFSWGGTTEPVSFTLAADDLRDTGRFWAVGAELTSARFPDIASTDQYARAPKSEGILFPLVYAPTGSSLRVPIAVVEDTTVNIISDTEHRRYAMCARRPADSGSAHQFALTNPYRDGFLFTNSETSTYYQNTPATDLDGLNEPYWYAPGNFEQLVNTGGTDTTLTATATFPKAQGTIYAGDLFKVTTDGDNDWRRVESDAIDDTVSLASAYAHVNTNADSEKVAIPANVTYPGYWICTRGGMGNASDDPITHVVDVLRDALGYSRLPVRIDFDGLEAFRPRLPGLNISTLIQTRPQGGPYNWCLSQLFAYLPIRPWRDGDILRFAWVGTVDESEVIATIDLDTNRAAYRADRMQWSQEDTYPFANMKFFWDAWTERHRDRLTASADLQTGRVQQAYLEYVEMFGCDDSSVPVDELEVDVVEEQIAAGLVLTWLTYLRGRRRQRMQIATTQELFYIRPGDHIRVTEAGVTYSSQIWRVEARTVSATGQGSLLLEASLA